MDVITVVKIKSFLAAESMSERAEFYGKWSLVTDKRVRSLVAGRPSPQLKGVSIFRSQVEMFQSQADTTPGSLVWTHTERLALETRLTSL